MNPQTFAVRSSTTNLTVTMDEGAVTRVRFGRYSSRRPADTLQRTVARELGEYLSGERRKFTFPIRPAGSEFERRVWKELARIPYGRTKTYGEVARAIGNPHAARAVGGANGRNPIPIVVPCHRVVAAGGKLGGFGGGLSLKKKLLDLETTALA